jgi:hypothetical protein
VACAAGAPARAAELCVKCTGPEANYACVVGGNSTATPDMMSKFYCITTLAKAGAHAKCSIDRSATAPCPGERKELPIPALLNNNDADGAEPKPEQIKASHAPPGEPAPAPVTDIESHQNATPPPPPATSEPPPKTVQEMVEKSAKSAGDGLSETGKSAGQAAKSAGTALEKAGSAVGGAAKNSWKCLSSFFSNC